MVLFSHLPLYTKATGDSVWDGDRLLSMAHGTDSSSCWDASCRLKEASVQQHLGYIGPSCSNVVAHIAGHTLNSGYARHGHQHHHRNKWEESDSDDENKKSVGADR